MKTLKNDTKYIIKKVIIGVLIAIVLFNARKCGVYAETNDLFVTSVNRSPINAYMNTSNPGSYTGYYNGSFTLYFSSSYDTGTNLSFNNTDYHLKTGISSSSSSVQGITRSFNHTIIFKSSDYNDTYLILDIHEDNSQMTQTVSSGGYINIDNTGQGLNFQFYKKVGSEYSLVTSSSYTTKILSSSSSLLATIGSSATNGSTSSKQTNIFYNTGYSYTQPYGSAGVNHDVYCLSGSYNYPFDLEGFLNLYGFEYYYSSQEVDIKLNNTLLEPIPQFPPSGYSELSLNGYQGVIFVPKNYSTMDYNSLYNLDFNYYYKGRVRDGYFLLNNSNQHYYDTDILISDDDYTERNGFYTLAKVQTTEGITNTTTIEYSAFVVYNSSPTGDWQGDILPPYGELYVVYDSTLYDYYLVEDFSTFNETICFYDFENNEICINVKSLPTLNDVLSDANSSTTNEEIPQQKINYILEFLKLPIRSLRRVAEGTCEAITLPIPIIGGTIQLNCLSSLFQNVLGPSFEFFRLIINGLLLYRITIHNIKVFKDVLDPSNTGIEVVNL